ncbi:MAG: hypothetical protein P8M08_16265 [Akkermansiaceae bacterium]|nr:hypothetical protein [Akkermansiaceae bacterium]
MIRAAVLRRSDSNYFGKCLTSYEPHHHRDYDDRNWNDYDPSSFGFQKVSGHGL